MTFCMNNLPKDELRQQLNLETGKITWPELQRHFARGVVVEVSAELDLVTVATKFVTDDKKAIKAWMDIDFITRPTDETALQWNTTQPIFWAIVAAPWVLVQRI